MLEVSMYLVKKSCCTSSISVDDDHGSWYVLILYAPKLLDFLLLELKKQMNPSFELPLRSQANNKNKITFAPLRLHPLTDCPLQEVGWSYVGRTRYQWTVHSVPWGKTFQQAHFVLVSHSYVTWCQKLRVWLLIIVLRECLSLEE